MTQVAYVKHSSGVRYLRPIDKLMIHIDIDFEYYLHLSTTYNLMLN